MEATKRCPKCKLIKAISEFSKNRKSKDELQSYCKKCKKIYQRNYRKTAKGKSYEKNYKQSKKAKVVNRASCNQYYKKHRKEQNQKEKFNYSTIKGYLKRVFRGMNYRCNNPKSKDYKYYGGRGIKVKFTSFDDFYNYVVNELKIDPRGLTIDRINNDGNYERGNIRFVTKAENNQNRRKQIKGKTK